MFLRDKVKFGWLCAEPHTLAIQSTVHRQQHGHLQQAYRNAEPPDLTPGLLNQNLHSVSFPDDMHAVNLEKHCPSGPGSGFAHCRRSLSVC